MAFQRLSPIEREVVQHMCDARVVDEISATLDLSPLQIHKLIDAVVEKLSAYRNGVATADAALDAMDSRRLEVLQLLTQENGNKQIGRSLGLSEGYVKKLIEEIFDALGVHSRTGAALRYDRWRRGRHGS